MPYFSSLLPRQATKVKKTPQYDTNPTQNESKLNQKIIDIELDILKEYLIAPFLICFTDKSSRSILRYRLFR